MIKVENIEHGRSLTFFEKVILHIKWTHNCAWWVSNTTDNSKVYEILSFNIAERSYGDGMKIRVMQVIIWKLCLAVRVN